MSREGNRSREPKGRGRCRPDDEIYHERRPGRAASESSSLRAASHRAPQPHPRFPSPIGRSSPTREPKWQMDVLKDFEETGIFRYPRRKDKNNKWVVDTAQRKHIVDWALSQKSLPKPFWQLWRGSGVTASRDIEGEKDMLAAWKDSRVS